MVRQRFLDLPPAPAGARWIQHRRDLPRIIHAGKHIARTRRYLRGFAVSFPAAVLRDAVAAAHHEGARVTAHCFAGGTLDDMLDAGIDCIEHATGLLPRHLPRFVEQGVPIVPTLINIATFPDIAAQARRKFPRYAAHMLALWERRAERVLEAFDAGVTVYAGTDAGSVINHGRIVDELEALHAAGLPAEAALTAGARAAREWLGVQAIAEGASADVLVCDGDPRRNLTTLRELKHIVLRGEVVRRHGADTEPAR